MKKPRETDTLFNNPSSKNPTTETNITQQYLDGIRDNNPSSKNPTTETML
ncbi:TPA: hypothetical protein I9Y85_003073 [Legionella pneumophila]|nr:hypothetical protein [Legionella pneumophila]